MADLATLPVYGCSIYVSLQFFGVSGSSETSTLAIVPFLSLTFSANGDTAT